MLVVFCHFKTRYTPLKLFPEDIPVRFPHKISHSISSSISCSFSHKNFPQDFPARFSHKNFPQDFPAKFSCKIFPQDFPKLDPDWLTPHHPIPNAKFPPITAFLKLAFPLLPVPQDFPTRFSHIHTPL